MQALTEILTMARQIRVSLIRRDTESSYKWIWPGVSSGGSRKKQVICGGHCMGQKLIPRSRIPGFAATGESRFVLLVSFLLFAYLIPIKLEGAVPGEFGGDVTNSILDRFKGFMSSPPLIAELVFDMKVVLPGGGANVEEATAASTNYQRYIARWQPNARSVYQVLPEFISTNKIINWISMSVFEDKRWHMAPNGIVILWHDKRATAGNAETNLVQNTVHYLTYRLAETLNMGVYGHEIGSIRWEGNSFFSKISNPAVEFKGVLHARSGGYPEHLDLSAESAAGLTRNLKIIYSFDEDTGLPYVPSGIRTVEIVNGKPRERGLIRIKSIELATEPAGEEAFLPLVKRLPVPAQWRYYTNGAYFARDSSGRLTPAPLRREDDGVSDEKRESYLAFWMAISFGILALTVRARRKTTTNRTLQSEQRKEIE